MGVLLLNTCFLSTLAFCAQSRAPSRAAPRVNPLGPAGGADQLLQLLDPVVGLGLGLGLGSRLGLGSVLGQVLARARAPAAAATGARGDGCGGVHGCTGARHGPNRQGEG